MILGALEQICHDLGLSTQRHSIPSVHKANGKTGRGDLIINDVNRHVMADVALTHEFCGNHLTDVSRNGQLRDPDVNKLLENAGAHQGGGVVTPMPTDRTLVSPFYPAFHFGRAVTQ